MSGAFATLQEHAPGGLPVELPDALAELVGTALATTPMDGHIARRLIRLTFQRTQARRDGNAEAVARIERHLADVAREACPTRKVDWLAMDWGQGARDFVDSALTAFHASVHDAHLAEPEAICKPSPGGRVYVGFRAWDITVGFRLSPGESLYVRATVKGRRLPVQTRTLAWPDGVNNADDLGRWWMQTHGVTLLVLASSPIGAMHVGCA